MMYLAKQKGIEPIIIPELGRKIQWLNDLLAFLKLYCLIKREKPLILHTHMAKAGTLGRLAALLAGVPVRIHTFHGHVFQGYFSAVKSKLAILIEKILTRSCQRIITISEGQFTELCNKYKIAPREKFSLVRLGFELDRFLNADTQKGKLRAELGIPSAVALVGIVGRLVPVKNHRLFFKAAARVLQKKPEVKFLVIGGGELSEELAAFVTELSIKEKVLFLGWRKDLDAVYADLDVVALTSLNEGTPVALVEAMASGKAVVATRVGGVPDVVRDGVTGILIPSGDVEGLASGILRLLDNEKMREDFGIAGREFVCQRFSKSRLIEDVTSLYTDLIRPLIPEVS